MQSTINQRVIADTENCSRMQDNETKPFSADKPAAGVKAATSPDRVPMVQLSPNAAYRPAKTPLQTMPKIRVPEVATSTLMSSRFGGSTTHREGSHTSPGMWRPASGSGSLTARGEPRVPVCSTLVSQAACQALAPCVCALLVTVRPFCSSARYADFRE